MAESEISIIRAPDKRIFRRPNESTIYHGGMVDSRYVMALIPVIRIAWRPYQPASSKTSGA
jgi:hypothetical protein